MDKFYYICGIKLKRGGNTINSAYHYENIEVFYPRIYPVLSGASGMLQTFLYKTNGRNSDGNYRRHW